MNNHSLYQNHLQVFFSIIIQCFSSCFCCMGFNHSLCVFFMSEVLLIKTRHIIKTVTSPFLHHHLKLTMCHVVLGFGHLYPLRQKQRLNGWDACAGIWWAQQLMLLWRYSFSNSLLLQILKTKCHFSMICCLMARYIKKRLTRQNQDGGCYCPKFFMVLWAVSFASAFGIFAAVFYDLVWAVLLVENC